MRSEVAERLRARTSEIEEAILVAVQELPHTKSVNDPNYLLGLRETIRELVALGVDAIAGDDGAESPLPIVAIGQARRAARAGVTVDTVLRRYAAGERVLQAELADEAAAGPRNWLQAARATMGTLVDRLMRAVAEEYKSEVASLKAARSDDRYLLATQLINGEVELDRISGYELGCWHVAALIGVPVPEEDLRQIARRADCRLLSVRGEGGETWAWFGRRRRLVVDELVQLLEKIAQDRGQPICVGEARRGLEGWRLSHREAVMASEYPNREKLPVLRAREVVLSVAILRDPVLIRCLLDCYVRPLESDQSRGGVEVRHTLVAYLAAGQTVTSAAAQLDIERKTVRRRLDTAEQSLGKRIEECHAELQVGMQVERSIQEDLRPEWGGASGDLDAAAGDGRNE